MDDAALPMVSAPAPPALPKWGEWAKLSGLTFRKMGEDLGVSHTHLWALALPYDDPRRADPSADLVERIEAYTKGAVTRAHWRTVKPARERAASTECPPQQDRWAQ